MDRLDELTALVAILESGSLAAAGRKLRRSPPAMTRLLASLEERVGARLIERTSRRRKRTDLIYRDFTHCIARPRVALP